ncbi:type I restriction enzyme M protein [Bacteroidales bacterium KHT7]|nr:type I restriction enzyme M protein [Bacteroidales bacterium KHT7]
MKYESTFNAIDAILRNEAGCSNELDYIEQTSWLLFLKYLDDLETEREDEAALDGKEYRRIITGFNRWNAWAAPKTAKGELDVINAMTGDDLVEFVNQKLFPSLKHFKDTAVSPDTLEYKIGEIFDELRNKINSGYNMREIINKIDSLHFQSADDKHEMTVLYEDKIRRMGNAGRNGGEYYTPRPLIRTIVKVVNPRIGETVYDPACGSAGFLCEAFNYMQEQIKSVADSDMLQKSTFYGKEKKGLPYIIATMNMIFHGVAAPNIVRGNTLTENLAAIQQRDRKDVILANPPFGGSERAEVLQNFDIRTGETAYMFMQHFIKMLKVNGRAGIVIKNTFLSNGDAAAVRRKLLEECNLHIILDLPQGVFTGAGVKTVVLFFTKGEPTRKIWYYQLNLSRTLGKTNPLNEADLADFVALQQTKAESENSWTLDASVLGNDYDLSVKNPNKPEIVDNRTTEEILSTIADLNSDSARLINEIKEML